MAIRTEFRNAVIGTEQSDLWSVALRINDPGINLVSVHAPLDDEVTDYLISLDVINTYLNGGKINLGPIESFRYAGGVLTRDDPKQSTWSLSRDRPLPVNDGYHSMTKALSYRAGIFQRLTGCDSVFVELQAISPSEEDFNFIWHPDDGVTVRGLQTVLGEDRTLWLPDRHVNLDWLGSFHGNPVLNVPVEKVRAHARVIDRDHLSFHKGTFYPNPLYHAAPARNDALGMRPGTRILLKMDVDS